MESIFISIAIGILFGWLDVFGYNKKKYLNHFSTAALFVMLWCLGAKIGCDNELLHNLGLLGFRAVVMAVGVIGGSLLVLWVVTKFLRVDTQQAEEEEK